MVMLLFVLDLRSLSPPLLEELKQCLLQLANLYAVSGPRLNHRNSDYVIEDRIGLCYLQRSAISSSNELKIAYSPRGRNFSLRDFHYAVKHLPSSLHSPAFLDDGSSLFHDMDFSVLLCDEVLDSAGTADIERKIILISSYLVHNMDSQARKTLLDAADRCVSMEFVFLEQKSSQLSDLSESINKFREEICDLENCSFNAYLPDTRVFNGLAKRWLQELKDSTEEIVEGRFVFKRSIAGSFNQISCKVCNSINQIMGGFCSCMDNAEVCMCKKSVPYDVRNPDGETDNADIDSMKVGKHTLTIEQSWRSWTNLQKVSSAVDFNVTERTNLASLNEGVVIGRPYIVIPSAGQDTDTSPEDDKSQLNDRIFRGLCRALYVMNQGLVCWSFCNIETMKETAFCHYYILQPSDDGPMLLRRLAGAEEILPLPDINLNDSSNDEGIDNSIQLCLGEVELKDYNPVQHSGGFHEKINQLVQGNLQPGLVTSGTAMTTSDSTTHDTPELSMSRNVETPIDHEPEKSISGLTQEWEQLIVGNMPEPKADMLVTSGTAMTTSDSTTHHDTPALLMLRKVEAPQSETHPQPPMDHEPEKSISGLTQEWEQLIVGNIPEPKPEIPKTSPLASQKPLHLRTSNILERLGNPKQMKTKGTTSPTVITLIGPTLDRNTENRFVLLSDDCGDKDLLTSSQLMKPNFQRLKRKLR